jgi:hypothetical protein
VKLMVLRRRLGRCNRTVEQRTSSAVVQWNKGCLCAIFQCLIPETTCQVLFCQQRMCSFFLYLVEPCNVLFSMLFSIYEAKDLIVQLFCDLVV